ncbi:thiamine pyrophosphate-requiring protein [Alicyclobacillus vulcanalis]|uniref:Acetolactate synthase-1/2/3 large subunit n=1 Tax=Alicyclobacillus vulcanalis TaxID=252246 RepID=A0A1N7N3S5_9BACL|nr:thiamine pyrophosphate-requiring protein [Alicyclobacillus vulcanalis]SIS93005.1 acetolactate synthase-1/2/3 large subunit [Alicyclobacillus vulcanalis]
MSNNGYALTAADGLLLTLSELGVDYIFANLGSDHPPLIESLAKLKSKGKRVPEIIICPHEMAALSAAHGRAQVTGKLQVVLVHVDVGTQNLGGALHNAMRGRVPILIIAGASPVTVDGEMAASRNEFIHYLQDISDQRSIVREYTKWSYDVHSGKNIDLIVKRAAQIACSSPSGPVYMMIPRDIMTDEWVPLPEVKRAIFPASLGALDQNVAKQIAHHLVEAKMPLIITSYLGRNVDAVSNLVQLSEKIAVPVMEAGPYYANFPTNHPMHIGYEDFIERNYVVEEADFILVLDCDIPWMPQVTKVEPKTNVFWIDIDPIKTTIPVWYYSGVKFVQAESRLVLSQLLDEIDNVELDHDRIESRRASIRARSSSVRDQWTQDGTSESSKITAAYLTSLISEFIDENTIIVNETISNYRTVWRHLNPRTPGQFYGSGASSLGWHGGAAVGIKLENPDKTVVALTGDGSFIFSEPVAVQIMSRLYNAPFLTVIYNNGGWKSPKLSTLAVYPHGCANASGAFHVEFTGDFALERVASLVDGVYIAKVDHRDELHMRLSQAFEAVRDGRSAVLNVMIEEM